MFRAGLLLIIRMYYSVYTATGICHVYPDWLLAASGRNLLYGYITMHSQQNIKFGEYLLSTCTTAQ